MSLEQIGDICIIMAGILWCAEGIPQIHKTLKTKDVTGLSFSFFGICWVAYLIYIFGNALLENWLIVVSHVPSYIVFTIMCCLIIKYKDKKDRSRIFDELKVRRIK